MRPITELAFGNGAEDAKELIALATNAAKKAELLQDHGPGNDGKEKKQGQDAARHPPRILQNAAEID